MDYRTSDDSLQQLLWLFIQGFFFLPIATGGFWDREPGWFPLALTIAASAWVTYAIARNLYRLWGVHQPSGGLLFAMAFVVLAFALSSTTMVYAATNSVVSIGEGQHIPQAVADAALALAVLLIAIRAFTRTRPPSALAG